MNHALFIKELRSLRPFLFIILAVVLVDVVDAFLTPFESRSITERLDSLADELGMLQIVLGFALGSSLLVREIDDGTLTFLDGLPLTRGAVFLAKIKAAMLVMVVLPVGLLLLHVGLHLATRESLNHALQPALLLTFFSLSMLVTAVALSAGLLLGFLRYLSWLVFALGVIGIKLMEDTAPSLAAALNTADLLTIRISGTAWQLPMPTIWTQLGLMLLFGVSAFMLFRSAGHVLAQVQRLQKPRRLLLMPVATLMLIAAIGGVIMLAERNKLGGGEPGADDANAVEFIPVATGQATTAHYTFSYPALSSARMRPLIGRADQTFNQVAALLHMDGGGPIDVDLSGAIENHAGTAHFDRIRMQVEGAGATATLAHETAHVFAIRLAGGEQAGALYGMMVFNEGLAEWIEQKVANPAGVNERHELVAAIVSARRLVTPRQLTDQGAFSNAVDQNLKYPLGAMFVERFVKRYGPQAPKTLLLALASEEFPRDLTGYELWQTAFQLANFDLDLVLDDYARHLKQLEPKFARQIAQLPRPRGSLVKQGDSFGVMLRIDVPLPYATLSLVRFRPGNSDNAAHYRTSYGMPSPSGNLVAQVPAHMLARGEICFQPGVMYEGVNIYEPWVCLPISSAS